MNHELSKRVRRAARKWPITELDPIEFNAFTERFPRQSHSRTSSPSGSG